MHELLKKFWKENNEMYSLQPMNAIFTPWYQFRNKYLDKGEKFVPEVFWKKHDSEKLWQEFYDSGYKGFIFEDHIGLQNAKDIAGEGLYVYAMRHGDDFCEPADIESGEVIVNFFAYFVTDQCLDKFFTGKKDWKKIYCWQYDWGEERYWED